MTASSDANLRRAVLQRLGAGEGQVPHLLRYNENHFHHDLVGRPVALPVPDEAFVVEWESYVDEAAEVGVLRALQGHLRQLNFPVQRGMSEDPEYRLATRKGAPTEGMTAATGLNLELPEGLELQIHPTVAGRIPILTTRERADFEMLLRALLYRNEPRDIPPSMGAAMIAGLNNWSRIDKLRAAFFAMHPAASEADWLAEFARIKPQHHLYQDRLILLSDSAYSGVSEEKRAISLIIRGEHEATHYVTRRLLGSMKNNLLDEFIADAAGIVAACGVFRAGWFLRFMGLENFPQYREGGRFQNYLADPPLPADCIGIQQALVVAAAQQLDAFTASRRSDLSAPRGRAWLSLALTGLTLEALASERAGEFLEEAFAQAARDFTIAEDWGLP